MYTMNLGRPLTKAERALVELRRRVEAKFDDIWERRKALAVKLDPTRQPRNYRKCVRRWLAKQIGVAETACNPRTFDAATCERALRVLEPVARKARHRTVHERSMAA